ncbi:heavy metal translocating P-type ATPase [Sedimenticola sp.]|uniref:heavy metal translocating P-type ATPase n=1 Tax=Sedimenticola sp. TaxID=1940285 RepID=UPI003D10E40D
MNHELQAGSGCFHCGLPLPPDERFSEEIDGATREFCCFGCQSVCQAIYEAGLEGFYQRTPEGTLLAPPPEPPKDAALYDFDEVQEEFIHDLGEHREIHLLVEGIHCAACVWLIERTLNHLPGVLKAQVNLSGKRLLLHWDNTRLNLSEIINRLGQIGYAAVPFDPEAAEGTIKKQNRALLFRMAFAGFTMMNLLWISIALYAGADTADDGRFLSLFQWLGFALATPTLFYSGWPFLKGAWSGLRNLHLTMDLPIAIGASTTYFYSVYITISNQAVGEVYFDTVVNFMFVILVGRYLEAMSKRHAVAATQRLMDLQPRVATVLLDGEEKITPIRRVKPEQLVLVKAGTKIPVDGIITEGRSSVDESMLSGESVPIEKQPGNTVSAGTMNLSSALTVRVTGTLRNTALGRIIALVEEAQASKAPIQCTADRIVPWFVMVTLILATVTFSWWLSTGFELALMAATSVLIITCPCAFGLATPMAIAVASGQGARHGILVKNGEVLETMSQISHVVFDKTGTLTTGRMRLQQIITTGDLAEQELLRLTAIAERYSEHSIASAIIEAATERKLINQTMAPERFDSLPGNGISAQVDGCHVIAGTTGWLEQHGVSLSDDLDAAVAELEAQAFSCVHIGIDSAYAGLLAIADELRPDARTLVENLRTTGIRMTLLSGDRQRVAEAIAEKLGGMEVIAEVLPQDKDRVIKGLQEQGEWVAMVGDGINDAPALIRANVGIAVGSGTDVSVESADIVLMSDELDKVRLATALSRRALRTIRQNIGISFAYNIIMVPLAMMAYITPLVAAVSMPISSLLVIGNAARIRTLFRGDR